MFSVILRRWCANRYCITSKTIYFNFNKRCFAKQSTSNLILKMNEAYLRYEKGDESFVMSFQYANEKLHVNRLCNFNRKSNETVSNFLKRIDINMAKILQKKKKKKKFKHANDDASADESKAILLRNNFVVDGEITCETVFEDTSELSLVILGSTYTIRHNTPWIVELSLPLSILASFPTYPTKFTFVYTDVNKSIFRWYRTKYSSTSSDAKSNDVQWEEVGKEYMYTPTSFDIGYRLKLSCLPINDNQTGPFVETESFAVVEAGPGHCPFQTRQLFTRNKLSGNSFRIVSYNILADLYADSDYSRDVLYPYCPSYALSIEYRKQLVRKELLGYNSDIICLQEVDDKVYHTDLLPLLSILNYEGTFDRKGFDIREGLATFFDEERFQKICSKSVVMSKNVETSTFQFIWTKILNEDTKKIFLERNTIVQATVLQSKENPSDILVIGNTHLYFRPGADHIRLLQAYYALTYIREIAKNTEEENPGKRVSIVLCGDFNSSPENGIYQFMTENHIPENYKDWSSHPEQTVENVSLSHDLSLASACGTPRYTNYTPEFNGCLDYIFYEKNKLQVTQVVPMPSDEEVTLHVALPSVVFPSDHISICADLKLLQNEQ